MTATFASAVKITTVTLLVFGAVAIAPAGEMKNRNGSKVTQRATLSKSSSASKSAAPRRPNLLPATEPRRPSLLPATQPRRPSLLPVTEPEMPADEPRADFGLGFSGNVDLGGIEVTDIDAGSKMEKLGVEIGDIILNVNGRPVRSVDEWIIIVETELTRNPVRPALRMRIRDVREGTVHIRNVGL